MLVAALVAAGLFAPASANAAVSATITGDDGQPVPMTVGAPPTIRNMNVSVAPALAQGDAVSWRYRGDRRDGNGGHDRPVLELGDAEGPPACRTAATRRTPSR